VDERYYPVVIQGMSDAVNTLKVPHGPIVSPASKCAEKRVQHKTHTEKNHAVFFAFAPRENPKIAIAVFVENAGYGGTWQDLSQV
jgi:penicillin-binding protein 2